MSDKTRPDYYNKGSVEMWDVVDTLAIGYTSLEAFCVGNIAKYIGRAPFKESKIQDLRKARVYLDRLIEEVERKD